MLDDHKFAGVLTRSDLMTGLSQKGRDVPVADFARTELASVEAGSDLIPAVTRLRETGLPCLQVVDGDRTVGLLTLENIGEYLMVRTALAGGPAARVNETASPTFR